jgi:hypothetical protein
MKTIHSVMLICLAACIAACGNSKNPSLSGVYVNHAQSEYSVASDTLIIDAVNLTNKTYSVERHAGFQKIRNGQKQPEQFKKESWQAIWDSGNQVLSEGEYGRQIRLSSDTPGVLLKTTLFKKIQ